VRVSPLASFDTLALTVGGTSLGAFDVVAPVVLGIGRKVDFVSELLALPLPGVLALATTALPLPIDLTPLGAPGNQVYLGPEVLQPLAWTPNLLGGQEARIGLPIPNAPALLGAPVYGQSVVLEPGSNSLGLVTNNAVGLRLGDPNATAPVRQVDEANATVGTVLDFQPQTGGPTRFGAVVFRLDGTFF
jgi:hypothetical protein